MRDKIEPRKKNVANLPLVQRDKILMPPLHIKLGLMKNFVKAMDNDSDAFRYLRDKFPELCDAKIKEGIFIGPQMRKIAADKQFEEL